VCVDDDDLLCGDEKTKTRGESMRETGLYYSSSSFPLHFFFFDFLSINPPFFAPFPLFQKKTTTTVSSPIFLLSFFLHSNFFHN